MIGAGTIISPIIKVVTTVAILAAIYFFFVKPALDTTESITGNINHTIDKSFDSFTPDVQQSVKQADKIQENAQQASSEALANANKLLKCIGAAGTDTDKITACNNKFAQ